jgi:YhcH/YjgK/YiaL family protein
MIHISWRYACGRRNFIRTLGAGAGLTLLPRDGVGKDSLMVQGDLKSWQTHPELRRLAVAFRFLERPDLAQLPLGKHAIDAKAYAIIDKSKSQPPEKVQFEAHRKYIDVHYMISGQVTTGFAPADTLKVITPYQANDDAASYAVPANYVKLKLYPGKFAVFFPGGGHMPNCHLDGSHDLHKVVVKVEHDYGLQA